MQENSSGPFQVKGSGVFNRHASRAAENRVRAIFVVLIILVWAVNRLSPAHSVLRGGSFLAFPILAILLVVIILKQVRRSYRT